MKHILLLVTVSIFLMPTCKKDNNRVMDTTYMPDVSTAKFTNSTTITNPYFPAVEGKKYIYEGQTEDGLERVEEQRLTTTKTILGIACIIVHFKEFLNGTMIEETWDWYAQDNDGNVWYFGEAVDNYAMNGTLQDHGGSWEAGVDGAQPGTIMPANPKTGFAYREEYYFNHAEDQAEIIATGQTVTVPLGTYVNCIKTKNWTELEPDQLEHKFYAPGVGMVKEINVNDNTEIVLKSIQ